MKTVLKGLTTAAFLAAAVAGPLAAQQQKFGIGIHGAYLDAGTLAKSGETRLQLDNKAPWGGNIEWWIGNGRFGLRADGSYVRAPLMLETEPAGGGDDTETSLRPQYGKMRALFADGDIMMRLLTPTYDRKFAPFLSVGAGFGRWDAPHDAPFNVTEANAQVPSPSQRQFAVAGSGGIDFFLTPHAALRLEAKDYYNVKSPYWRIDRLGQTENDTGSRHHGGAHNMVYSAGLTFLFGGHRVEEPGFIAAAPTPPPPAPEPAPAPRVTTERVSMCVVNADGQLTMVDATRNLDTRAITVMRNGQQVAFTSAYPTAQPYYIQGAPWYVASKPFIISLDKDDMGGDVDDELDDTLENLPENRLELVAFGSTTPLPTGDVLYVGSWDGTPLYAKRTDIAADLLPDLQARLRTTQDLDVILDDEAFADRWANGISTFYLAIEPGAQSCVFQPVSSTRVVRRTRG